MVSPLEYRSLKSSHQDCSLSRYPSSTAISSFFPSARAPMSTSKQTRASSKRTLQYTPSAQTLDVVLLGEIPLMPLLVVLDPLLFEPADGVGR